MAVWSAVRVTLLTAPRLCVWFTASAHAWLDRSGGPAGRNWLSLLIENGVSVAHWGSSAGMYIGAVSCQSPGFMPGM